MVVEILKPSAAEFGLTLKHVLPKLANPTCAFDNGAADLKRHAPPTHLDKPGSPPMGSTSPESHGRCSSDPGDVRTRGGA